MGDLQLNIILGYKDIYDKLEFNVLDKLIGYNPDNILLILSHLKYCQSKNINDINILKKYFTLQETLKYLLDFKILSDFDTIRIFNDQSSNLMICEIISNYTLLKNSNIEKNNFIDFVHAYLKINETAYGGGNLNFNCIPKQYFEEISQFFFLTQIYDFQRSNNLSYQVLRVKALLKFFYQNEIEIFNSFCEQNDINNIDNWLIDLLTSISYKDNNKYNILNFESNHFFKEYLKEKSINSLTNTKLALYSLQLYPVYQLNETSFIIFDWNNLFHGMYYKIDQSFYKLFKSINPKFTKYPNYKAYISKEVSEKLLFQFIIKQLIKSKNSITHLIFDNNEIGFVDCYLRIGYKIYMIEFKDYTASKEILNNKNIQNCIDYIDDKFVNKKGVSQLSKFIKNSINNNFKFDEKLLKNYISLNKLEIIPMIVVSEEIFSAPPLENYLAKKFNEIEINHPFKRINKLTLLSITDLILYLNSENNNFFKDIAVYSKKNKITIKNDHSLRMFNQFKFKSKHSDNNKFLEELFTEFSLESVNK